MNQVQEIFNFLPYGNTLSKALMYFVGSAFLAFIFAPLIIDFLYYFNIRRVSKGDVVGQMDIDKGKIGTPLMGGLIVIITTFVVTFMFNWEREFTWLPIGALLLSCSIGGIDDLLNIFGEERKQPKPLKLHLKLARVHKSKTKRIFYIITTPWAALKRIALFLGSRPTSGLQVHEKLIIQAFIGVTVGVWIYTKVGWSDVWIPYVLHSDLIVQFFNAIPGFTVNIAQSSVDIGWLMVPFVALTIMTVTNGVNFTDGMDGLAGGLLLFAFLAYAVIAFNLSQIVGNEGYRHLCYLSSTVAGALLAYLYFNVKPARIQMSDVGSLGLGTLLSVIAIITHREFTLLFIAGIFLFDGLFSRLIQSFWRRFFGKKLFRIIPIHYHFERIGWSEEKVVMRFWIIGGLLAAIGVWIAGF